jgi:hypothetical protein
MVQSVLCAVMQPLTVVSDVAGIVVVAGPGVAAARMTLLMVPCRGLLCRSGVRRCGRILQETPVKGVDPDPCHRYGTRGVDGTEGPGGHLARPTDAVGQRLLRPRTSARPGANTGRGCHTRQPTTGGDHPDRRPGANTGRGCHTASAESAVGCEPIGFIVAFTNHLVAHAPLSLAPAKAATALSFRRWEGAT